MIQQETLELLEWARLCQHLSTFASTKLGATAARQLRIPTTQSESEHLLELTREAYRLDGKTNLSFSGVQDIGDALERAERQGLLSGEELLAIATTLNGARQLRRMIDAQEDLPVLQALVADLRTYPELEQEIHRCIDDRGDVADRASPKLAGIREQLKASRNEIYQKLQRILQRHAGAVQEQLITQRSDRFVIPVKAPQKDAIPGIVHDASTSGLTLFVEPHNVVELGNRLRQLQRQERAEEEIVLRELTAQVTVVQPELEQLLVIVTTLDLATARARYSYWLEGNAPRFIAPDEQATLRQLRHPLLVWQQRHEQGPAVVPINVIVKPHLRVVAITGPNTGGKTVTLKTLGLAALMAKVGLFIPAREPVEIPWFDQVLADIGDEQSIEQSLSTFSGHIRRISRILEALQPSKPPLENESQTPLLQGPPSSSSPSEAQSQVGSLQDSPTTPPVLPSPRPPLPASSPTNTLVLLDEVGAGTDPSEGSALAASLLRHLADKARLTVATTHYGELKALKYQDERFENASVEFDDVTLSPTYRLLWGIPGRSNALTIAQRLGLDAAIVEAAREQVGMSNQEDVNQVIAGLEAQRKVQEDKASEAAKLLAQAEKLHNEVSHKAQMLRERERDLQQQQEKAIQQAIHQAKDEIARVIRRLQQGDATAQAAQKATDAVNAIAGKHLPTRQATPKPKPGFKPKVGDRIRIPSLGQTAEVLTDPDEDGKLTVRFGLLKTTVSLADIESLHGEKAELPVKPKPQDSVPVAQAAPPAPAVRTSRNTFDIRGMRVAEAESVLENAIATANRAIWIIHGHGTGKLKRGVHEYLQRHPQVQRFEAAEATDGGTGVTVAYV
ncbi:endonuclease MutS2 [Pseudanabaena sp. FACHB-2040]|uniref:endonuclease MutS2 n=1 Tax=Pseudanabaena sp. FACHB-2040 TaxID=2692859 RepID=UPI00168675D1|nr:endonuclease MutS2 [Pseudanabaena sp. FACHB-2040]MBD2257447.1 endonuclease MutS2 [Pseudanabaena sp. FACHB-2040]